MDPASGAVHVHRNGGFEEFDEDLERLPVALSSARMVSPARSNIFPWPGFKRLERIGDRPAVKFFASHILVFVVVAPGFVFAVFALLWLLGWVPSERVVSRITGLTFSACASRRLRAIVWKVASTRCSAVTVTFGNWFAVRRLPFPAGTYGGPAFAAFPGIDGCAFRTDRAVLGDLPSSRARVSAILPSAAPVRIRIFARIRRWFVRSAGRRMGDRGHHVGVVDRDSFSSGPRRWKTDFACSRVYRACDIGLLLGVFAMHHWAGTALFAVGLPTLTGTRAVVVCLLLLVAAAGKAAQVPFSGWLPRAMEGPTPSSAIFYGAISIHAGAYLVAPSATIAGRVRAGAPL